MAISISNLTSDRNTTDDTSFTTASVAPTTGNLVIVTVTGVSAGTNSNPTLSGHSLTWDTVETAGGSGTDVTGRVMRTFRAISDGTSGALTIDWGATSQARCFWSVEEVTGFATGANGANAIGVTAAQERASGGGAIASYTVTLATFEKTDSGTYGGFHYSNATAVTEGSGFTELSDETVDAQATQTQWKNTTDTSVDWSFSSADAQAVALAMELRTPTTGGLLLNTMI